MRHTRFLLLLAIYAPALATWPSPTGAHAPITVPGKKGWLMIRDAGGR